MIQISKILKQVPIFRTLGKESIDFIVERLKFKTFDNDDIVCKIGDQGNAMYIIITGKVNICIYSADGQEQIVNTLGPGDYFGEMALLTGEPRSATVKTSEPSEMFLLYKGDFDVILERFPSISLSMGKIVSKRLRETLSKATQLPQGKDLSAQTGLNGSLQDKTIVDLITFCEGNSLTGTMILVKGNEKGIFEYKNGEVVSVELGALKDDKALDTILGWKEGKFEIKVKPLTLDVKEKVISKDVKEILIINNSLVVRKLIERAFKGLGYSVGTAESIKKAQELINQKNPDIVITDVKLADGMGLDFCRSIRAQKDIPFIFLADDSLKSDFEQELRVVGKAALTKTHEVSEIVKLVENMI
jgi:CRP-like cAMP-binding protein